MRRASTTGAVKPRPRRRNVASTVRVEQSLLTQREKTTAASPLSFTAAASVLVPTIAWVGIRRSGPPSGPIATRSRARARSTVK